MHTRFSFLKLLCKTHKCVHIDDPVEFRNIHASPRPSWKGLSLWVAWELREALSDACAHFPFGMKLLSSAAQFVREVSSFPLYEHACMSVIDIRHFYMSGELHDLAECSSSIIQNEDKRIFVKRAALWLLSHQYVQSPHNSDVVYQVKLGSGMGAEHSGPIANATFFQKVERYFIDNPGSLEGYRVSRYYRYEDDVYLMLARHPDSVLEDRVANFEFMEHLRKQQIFKIRTESVSSSKVSFLSLEVLKDSFGHVKTIPLVKESRMSL